MSSENNYILDNKGLMFQFPLCGEEAAVGKYYVSGNETQMSLTLWSEAGDVREEVRYEKHPSPCVPRHCPSVMLRVTKRRQWPK